MIQRRIPPSVVAIGRLAHISIVLALGAVAALPAQQSVRVAVGLAPGEVAGARTAPDLDTALDLVRAQRAAERSGDAAPATIEVLLGPGTHERSASIVIDAAAGGAPGAPTVLCGVAGRTLITGARTVPPGAWSAELPAELRARLPDDRARAAVRLVDLGAAGIAQAGGFVPRGMGRATEPAPTELFWGDRPLPFARWPNTGTTTVTEVIDSGSVPRDREPDGKEPGSREPLRGGTFRIDVPRVERWVAAAAAGDAWAHGYWHWDWADELLQVDRVDPATRRITLAQPHRYGLGPGARFCIVNVLEELDQPGECVLLTGRNAIAVWPPDDAADVVVRASTLAEPLVVVRDADHVVIRDVELAYTRGAAVRVEGGSFVTVEGCAVRCTGADGIVMRGLGHSVLRCSLEDVGATAISAEGGDRATLTPGSHRIEDCDIARFGRLERTYRPAVALSGVGHRVAHNRIHDAPHSAVLVTGNEHLVEQNEISRVLLETGDCGAIMMGRDWAMHGVVVRHNVIRDLPGTTARWQNAIYLDDMASGITVEGNVLWRCNLGMLVGGGRSLTIRHNVLIDCGNGIRFDARGVGWMAQWIADPATSTLHRRLALLPVDRPPWSERYPEVATTLTVGFGRPVGSAVVGNAFFRTPVGTVDDPESVRVDGNRSFDRELDPTASPQLEVPEIPGFPPIPVGTIGPRH
ncbi:MAG: right-handed parallel beta-helix repeat-containing protein [Planctomycetes bacterium]|nr:right-handed parallel beta-helix repeat-containing protein [Planctomycetota bacterium]